MKPDIYAPSILLPHTLGVHTDVYIENPVDTQVLQYVEATGKWSNSFLSAPEIPPAGVDGYVITTSGGATVWAAIPAQKLFTGGTDLPYADAAAVRTALSVAPFSGSRTDGYLTRWDASGNLVNSGLSDDGTTLIGRKSFTLGGVLAADPGIFTDIGALALYIQASTGGRHYFRLGSTYVGNWASAGLAVNKGTTLAARQLEVADSTAAQFRLTHTAGVYYADFQVDTNGYLTTDATGHTYRWQRNGDATKYLEVVIGTGGCSLAANGATALLFKSGVNEKFRIDPTGVGFFAVTPVARASAITQTYATTSRTHAARTYQALTDSSGGSASTTLASIADAATANAIASLAARIAELAADQQNTAQVLNAHIDDQQAYGLAQ